MIKLITGRKGTGKTKTLIDMINKAVTTSDGNIVCIEKSAKLTFDVPSSVRLIDVDDMIITGYDSFLGFIQGVLAGNYDIKEVFVDSIFKICGSDMVEFEKFINNLYEQTKNDDCTIVFTVSADISELPEGVKRYI